MNGLQRAAAVLVLGCGDMRIEPPSGSTDHRWLGLRLALWPHASADEHLQEMRAVTERGDCILLALGASDDALGLAEAAKRHDYVNGTETSPVAFLEGLYVVPRARRTGIARALVAAIVEWARGEGLSELASDASLDNAGSHAMHRALGFAETERVVFFRRGLG